MNFSNLLQNTNRTIGSALINMALLTGSITVGNAAPTYYSGRRGGSYSRKNQSYLVDQGIGAISKELLTGKKAIKVNNEATQLAEEFEFSFRKNVAIKELVIVDRNIKDYHLFSQMTRPGVEVIEIPKEADGLSFLLQTLSNYQGLEAVHLLSHATSGKLALGSQIVDSKTLQSNLFAFNVLNEAIIPGGDLLLYGCELAKGSEGDNFLEIIKGNTHVDVAASNDLTGNAEYNGNWELEIKKGDINATPLEGSIALKDFSGVLQTYDFESGTVDGFYSNTVFQTYGGHTMYANSTPGYLGRGSVYYLNGVIGSEALVSYYSGENTNLYFYLGGSFTFDFNAAEFVGLYAGGQIIRIASTKGYVDVPLGYHSSLSFNISNLTVSEQDYFKGISVIGISGSLSEPIRFLIDNFNITNVVADVAPTLSTVTISSNNAQSNYAKLGDVVTLSFVASEAIQTPTVSIAGKPKTPTGSGASWSATHTMTGTDTETSVAFSISYQDFSNLSGSPVTTTTNSSSVIFDKTVPTLTAVTMSTNNPKGSTYAIAGNTVTLTIGAIESINQPVITILGNNATVSGASKNWTATYLMQGTEPNGTGNFNVAFSDLAGNAGTNVTAVTSGEVVIVDNTVPSGYSIAVDAPFINSSNFTVTSFTFTGAELSTSYSYSISSTGGGTPVTGGGSITVANQQISGISVTSLNEGVLTYSVTLSDSYGNIGPAAQSTVTYDKTPPVVSGPATPSILEGTTLVGTYTANEPLSDTGFAGIDGGLFNISPSTGNLSFVSAPDFENPLDNGANNVYDVQIDLIDVAGNHGYLTVVITITDKVDETPPTITGPSGGAGATTSTLSIAENTTAIHTFTANETVTWSLNGGEDASKFTINSSGGSLAFAGAPDFENPTDGTTSGTNSYIVIVNATDGSSNSSQQTLTVTITDVDEIAPLITGPSGGAGATATSKSITENTAAVHTFTANESATWSLNGGEDILKFALNSTSGVLTFTTAPDFENPTDGTTSGSNTYVVNVSATDGASNASTQTVTVTVTDLNDVAPIIQTTNLSVTENSAVGANVGKITATDPDTNTVFTWSLGTGNTDLDADGIVPFAINPTTGDLLINDQQDIDYEKATSFSLQVIVSDGTNTGGSTILISIIDVDENAPGVTISSPATNPSNLATISVNYSFSEKVKGFALTDVNISNGALSSLITADSISFTATLTPTITKGTITQQVAAGSYTDATGNSGSASNIFSLKYDNVAPTVTITTGLTNPTKQKVTPVTIIFSEAVSGFSLSGIQVSNGSASNLTGSLTSYQADITATTEGSVTFSILASAAIDSAGNGNTASAGAQFIYDITAPVISVDPLQTLDDTPPLSGTVNDINAVVSVKVNGQTVSATVNANSTWSVADNTINSLTVGKYDIQATATDKAGNLSNDNTSNELDILGGAPQAIAATSVTFSSFTANWQPRSGVTSYQLDVATDATFTKLLTGFNNFSTTQTSVNVNAGVSYGSVYYYRVRSVYSGAPSVNSNSIQVITPIDANTLADSVALLKIYDALGGATWKRKNNWRANQPLKNWTNVVLTQTRVTSVDLSSNNLRGDLPAWGIGLELVASFKMNGNFITTIPVLTTFSGTQFDLKNNRLQFGTLEPNVANSFVLVNPQDSVSTKLVTLQQQGAQYLLDRTITGSNNVYTWFKQENSGTVNPLTGSGATRSLSITAFSDEGKYFATVTNSNVPGLTLTTQPIEIRVSSLQRDELALKAIYNSMNGATWTSNARNWLTAGSLVTNQTAWVGVTVQNERVTSLSLPTNGLVGELPSDILDIAGLITVNLSGNAITGVPTFTDLKNLTSLNLSANNLDFDDLERNITVAGFQYANQARTGVIRQDTIASGSPVTVNVTTGGENNVYQWYLANDLQPETLISGATSKSYQIPAISYENMGLYRVKITNSKVPGITIEGRRQTVLAYAEMRFKGLDGDNLPIITGKGYALKDQGIGRPFDSASVVSPINQEFFFGKLVLGDYLIAIKGDTSKFLPTYFTNTFLWEEADTLRLRADINDTIFMTKKPPILTPIYDTQVAGFVESDLPDDPDAGDRILARRKVTKAGCSMRKFKGSGRVGQEELWELIAYVETNDEGQFVFDYLPPGLYRFNIEYPGIPMDPNSFVEFEIGEGDADVSKFVLEAYVTENGIEVTQIEALGNIRKYFKDLQVYPNPADRTMHLSYSKLMADEVYVEIIDLSGKVRFKQVLSKGYDQSYEFNTELLPDGFYVLNFVDTSSADRIVSSVKVMVKH